MKLYDHDQSDSQYMQTLRIWQKGHEATAKKMAREIKKIEEIKRSERPKPKKNSLFSRIIKGFWKKT